MQIKCRRGNRVSVEERERLAKLKIRFGTRVNLGRRAEETQSRELKKSKRRLDLEFYRSVY